MPKAKSPAQAYNTALRALIEQGLEKVLRDLREPKPDKLNDGSVTGRGLQPRQKVLTWAEVRELV